MARSADNITIAITLPFIPFVIEAHGVVLICLIAARDPTRGYRKEPSQGSDADSIRGGWHGTGALQAGI